MSDMTALDLPRTALRGSTPAQALEDLLDGTGVCPEPTVWGVPSAMEIDRALGRGLESR